MAKSATELTERKKDMKFLEEKILKDGRLLPGGILKVDNFLNHRMDIELFCRMGQEFARLFAHKKVTKILTVEASGIGVACIAAQYFGNVPVVFAKKSEAKNLDSDVYSTTVRSYTKGKDFTVRVSKNYISPDDKILIIDDFLAVGEASLGLIDICRQAGASVSGVGICIEKEFQGGGKRIRDLGIELHSLAVVNFTEGGSKIEFAGEA